MGPRMPIRRSMYYSGCNLTWKTKLRFFWRACVGSKSWQIFPPQPAFPSNPVVTTTALPATHTRVLNAVRTCTAHARVLLSCVYVSAVMSVYHIALIISQVFNLVNFANLESLAKLFQTNLLKIVGMTY